MLLTDCYFKVLCAVFNGLLLKSICLCFNGLLFKSIVCAFHGLFLKCIVGALTDYLKVLGVLFMECYLKECIKLLFHIPVQVCKC